MEELTSALIFVRTRAATGELAAALSARGFTSEALNGDLNQDARERTLNRFRNAQVKVLVATDVAARGIHVEGIAHVVNYDLPQVPEDFIHRVGRTGRAGAAGTASTFATRTERADIAHIERILATRLVRRQVSPGDRLLLSADIVNGRSSVYKIHGTAMVGDELACEAIVIGALR